MPRSSVLPGLRSGLLLVAVVTMVAFGFGRLGQVSIDLPLDTETGTNDVEQLITAPVEQNVLNVPLSIGALDSRSAPELSSGWTPPAKRPLHVRRHRSPRRGGSRSPMPLPLLHAAFQPERQLPVPADARSAISGKPVAVFAVLRN